MDNYRYRGVAANCALRIALGYWGSIQIELIQPLNDADTLYTRDLPNEVGKINHYATNVSDLDGLLMTWRLHDRVLQSGEMSSGAKFVYLEEYLPGGHHLELVQTPKSSLAMASAMEAAARQWDGIDPVRSISALEHDLANLSVS